MRNVRLVLCCAVAVLAGCHHNAASLRIGAAASSRRPGQLPDPVDKMLGHNAIGDIVDTLTFGDSTIGYIAGDPNDSECAHVMVSIWPTAGSSLVSPTYVPGLLNGAIVAVVKNETGCDKNALHLPGGHRGAWIAVYTATNTGASAVVDIDRRKWFGLGPHNNQQLEKIGFDLGSCGVTHPGQSGDQAAITTRIDACKYRSHVVSVSQVPAKQGTHAAVAGDDDPTLWFGCSATCCYASGLEF
jgi:hypothetical protein